MPKIESGMKFTVGLAMLASVGVAVTASAQLLMLWIFAASGQELVDRPIFLDGGRQALQALSVSGLVVLAGGFLAAGVLSGRTRWLQPWVFGLYVATFVAWLTGSGEGFVREFFALPTLLVVLVASKRVGGLRQINRKLAAVFTVVMVLPVCLVGPVYASSMQSYRDRVGLREFDGEVAALFQSGAYAVTVSRPEDEAFTSEAVFDFEDCMEFGKGMLPSGDELRWRRDGSGRYFSRLGSGSWLSDASGVNGTHPFATGLFFAMEQANASDWGLCRAFQNLANVGRVTDVVQKNGLTTYTIGMDADRVDYALSAKNWRYITVDLDIDGVAAVILDQQTMPAFSQSIRFLPGIEIDINDQGLLVQARTLYAEDGGEKTTVREVYTFTATERPGVETPKFRDVPPAVPWWVRAGAPWGLEPLVRALSA